MKLPKSSGKPKRPKLYIRRVTGNSMLPALRPDKIVVGWSAYGRLQSGDIVIITHDGLEKIKRIKEMRSDSVFIVGDNMAGSVDSRTFGWLPISMVLAKLIWPRL